MQIQMQIRPKFSFFLHSGPSLLISLLFLPHFPDVFSTSCSPVLHSSLFTFPSVALLVGRSSPLLTRCVGKDVYRMRGARKKPAEIVLWTHSVTSGSEMTDPMPHACLTADSGIIPSSSLFPRLHLHLIPMLTSFTFERRSFSMAGK